MPGSVIASAVISSPLTIPGSQRARCSSLARCRKYGRQMSLCSVIDRCLQLFGGYGYMLEYPIARAYADARVTTIYGGTTEIMKEIIGKQLGL